MQPGHISSRTVSAVTISLYSGGVHWLRRRDRARRQGSGAQFRETLPARHQRRAFDQEIITMRVALLTGGGDCPGLNAVIYAAV